jgi:hypothetical protein
MIFKLTPARYFFSEEKKVKVENAYLEPFGEDCIILSGGKDG